MTKIIYRQATPEDAESVVALSQSVSGKQNRWSVDYWKTYYSTYPTGTPFILVAETSDGSLVGHYSLLPVELSFGLGMMQSHIFVHPEFRGVNLLAEFMNRGMDYAKSHSAKVMLAFTQPRFAMVLKRLYGWKLAGHLSFCDYDQVNPGQYADHVRFTPDDAWYKWRFGDLEPPYIFPHNHNDRLHQQLWKSQNGHCVDASKLGFNKINCWQPDHSDTATPPDWGISLVINPITDISEKLMDIRNWYIEIGDSDIHLSQLQKKSSHMKC